MKRKRTQLEKSLIEKGWVLSHKKYYGKHCDKILSYTYIKTYENSGEKSYINHSYMAQIELNAKRNEIIDIYIQISGGLVDETQLYLYANMIKKVEKEVFECQINSNSEELTQEEIVECVEALGDSNENRE